MIACENSGHSVLDDFAEVSKIVDAGVITNAEFAFSQSTVCYFQINVFYKILIDCADKYEIK